MKTILSISLLLLLATPTFCQEPALDSIDHFITSQAKKFHIPGIAACVIKGDQIVWSNGYGYRNIEQALNMTPQSIMNIASISKTITATAIMQLWEQKKLDLNADINSYLDFKITNPHFPDAPISIQQLLTHSSSIADGSATKIAYECGEPSKTLEDWLKNYFTPGGSFYHPDENFHKSPADSLHEYSNLGFGVLGLIVEKVSGMAFNEYINQYIFAPLEMQNSGYFLREVADSHLVTPYLYLGPLQQNIDHSPSKVLPYFNPYCRYSFWNYPDGLVRTSIEDLAKFAIAYMNNGFYKKHQILQKETIELMMKPQLTAVVNEDQDQGLCWFQSQSLFPAWYHGGSDPGVSTRMYINKEDQIAVIVFQNANEDNTFYIVRELYKRFHK